MGWYRRSLFDAFRRLVQPKRSIVSSSGNNNINAFRFQKINHSNSLINGPMRKMFYCIRKVVRYVPHITVSGLVISNLLTELIRYESEFCETVPYSKRKHVMIYDWDAEKEMASGPSFEKVKARFGNKILPPDHPTSIRVHRIAQNIVEAALKTHDENLKHLEGLEFTVVDKPTPDACCCLAGKIFISTAMLERLESDAETAVVLGHEVAHVVARHPVEKLSHIVLLQFRTMFLPRLVMPTELLYDIYETIFLRLLPFQRRREYEADYIGMLLMASAGYDPRVSPLIWKRWAEINRKSNMWGSIFSTHPSLEKRAQVLSRPKVMKEAICLYREAQLRQAISRSTIETSNFLSNLQSKLKLITAAFMSFDG